LHVHNERVTQHQSYLLESAPGKENDARNRPLEEALHPAYSMWLTWALAIT